jgi:hypothetical protein
MKDLAMRLKNEPGALAEMGEILGKAGVSLEGGAMFVCNGEAIAHFLVEDPEKGSLALRENGIEVIAINDVLIQKLKQEVPGQLGKICRVMQQNNVNILVQYSDHYNQLVLIVDDHATGLLISQEWSNGKYE